MNNKVIVIVGAGPGVGAAVARRFAGEDYAVGLIKPVLDTSPAELLASLELNIVGAAAAVRQVVPAMQAAGTGSLLFTTGSAALYPNPDRAASAVTTTAATMYIGLLRQALAGSAIRVGHTVVVGPIGPDGYHPTSVADDLWRQHRADAVDFPSVLRLPKRG